MHTHTSKIDKNPFLHDQTLAVPIKGDIKAFMGVGFMNSKGEISTGIVPLDFLNVVMGARRVKEMAGGSLIGRKFHLEIFLGDVNAIAQLDEMLEVGQITAVEHIAKSAAVKESMARFRAGLGRLLAAVGMAEDTKVVVGSEVVASPEYRKIRTNINPPVGVKLDKYEVEQLAAMKLYKERGFDLRISWVADMDKPASRDERYFDELYERAMGEKPLASVYARAGIKADSVRDGRAVGKGIAVPYGHYADEFLKKLAIVPCQSEEHIASVMASKQVRRRYMEMVGAMVPGTTDANLAENTGRLIRNLCTPPHNRNIQQLALASVVHTY
ncbi:MAG: hypothetical protein LBL52_03835 [Rickettsiales bacterium]|jgi:hypothetical protein|nr:hypothetical protein [Rickettsiales bacterium]